MIEQVPTTTTPNILVISGKKQSGKTSLCNFLHGWVLKEVAGSVKEFEIDKDGDLLVNAVVKTSPDRQKEGTGVLDIFREDPEFASWASQKMWPWIKGYSFADSLKDICIEVFGLSYEQCFGTDEEKNSPTTIRWSDMSFALPPRVVGKLKKEEEFNNFLSGREFMQQFGTNICRKISNTCWIDNCFKKISAEQPLISVICDGRFTDEIDRAKELGAKAIRLNRKLYGSKDIHKSETELDNYDGWDMVIDNIDMSIDEKNQEVLRVLMDWGWLEEQAVMA